MLSSVPNVSSRILSRISLFSFLNSFISFCTFTSCSFALPCCVSCDSLNSLPSAVILLRSVNIPARYVEGYRIPADRIAAADTVNTVNTLQQNKSIITESVVDVKSSDAHAWVEAYLDGYGWITVDVTPSSQNEENVSQEQPQEQET